MMKYEFLHEWGYVFLLKFSSPGSNVHATPCHALGVVSYDVVLDAFDAGWETGIHGSHREKLETNAHGGGGWGCWTPLHLKIESLCKCLMYIWLVVSKIFFFHPYLGKIPNLSNIFQRG